jgi:hypothetical protein
MKLKISSAIHRSTMLCVMPSVIFLALESLNLSSAPPTSTIDVSALILSRISSRSSDLVWVEFSPMTNKVGVLKSNNGSSGSPLMPSSVLSGNPRQTQALIPPTPLFDDGAAGAGEIMSEP